MFLSNLSIKRPVFATVMMLALVTLGAFSFRRLAIDMDLRGRLGAVADMTPGRRAALLERVVGQRASTVRLPRRRRLLRWSWVPLAAAAAANQMLNAARARAVAASSQPLPVVKAKVPSPAKSGGRQPKGKP